MTENINLGIQAEEVIKYRKGAQYEVVLLGGHVRKFTTPIEIACRLGQTAKFSLPAEKLELPSLDDTFTIIKQAGEGVVLQFHEVAEDEYTKAKEEHDKAKGATA